MWEPRPLAALWASMACNRDIFTFFYSLPDIIRMIQREKVGKGYVGHMEEERSACKIVVGKHERKTLHRRPRHKCKNSIRKFIFLK
jgi:hypothetical protein